MNRRAALLVAGATVITVATVGFTIELLRSRFVTDPVAANYLTLPFATALAALWVGVTVAIRRPHATSGWLLVAGATGTALGFWRFSTHPWPAAIGMLLFLATFLLPLHAAVAQGTGVGRGTNLVLAAATGVLAALAGLILATAPAGAVSRWFVGADSFRHVDNVFDVFATRSVAQTAEFVWWTVLITAAVIGVASRVRGWRASPRTVRREEIPVVASALGWTVAIVAAAGVAPLDRVPATRIALADYGNIALPALALGVLAAAVGWVELVAPRLHRQAGAIELRDAARDRTSLQALLADLLATPHVEVAYVSGETWIDTRGRPFDLENDARPRTMLRVDGITLAAVLHDRDVPRDAVQLGARLAAAQLAAERATALARARTERVRIAAAELIRAGDRAADAVSREMLAGPIPEMVALSEQLRADPSAAGQAADALRNLTASVRELSHGMLPRDLEDHGLAAALGSRADLSRRLPNAVEVTVYLLAADDPHARVVDYGDTIVVSRTVIPNAEAAARTAALGGRIDGTVATVPAG